jgi:hypothetical protein
MADCSLAVPAPLAAGRFAGTNRAPQKVLQTVVPTIYKYVNNLRVVKKWIARCVITDPVFETSGMAEYGQNREPVLNFFRAKEIDPTLRSFSSPKFTRVQD